MYAERVTDGYAVRRRYWPAERSVTITETSEKIIVRMGELLVEVNQWDPAVLEEVRKHTPLGVLPEVGDIAAAVLFLASSAARCITGVTLPVDSGYLAR